MKKQKRFSLIIRITLIIVIMGMILGVGAVSGSYYVHKQTVDALYEQTVSDTGCVVSAMLDGEAVKAICEIASDEEFLAIFEEANETGDEDMVVAYLEEIGAYDTYQEVETLLLKAQDNMSVEYCYLVDNTNGYHGYSVCLIDPSEGVLLMGARDENEGDFAEIRGNVHIDATISHSEFGWLCSGYEPVYDEEGNAIALVGVDISMDDIVRERQEFLVRIIAFIVTVIVVTTISGIMFFRRTLVKPLDALSESTQSFLSSDEENMCSNVPELKNRTKDEISDLYDAIRKMEDNIFGYIDNIKTVTAEKERIGAELTVATQIQASMLPCIFPPFPECNQFDIYATMTPAKEVGGDFYDFFKVDDDHVALIIADVSGKGVPAALFMVISKVLLQNSAQLGKEPQDVLAQVNNQLCVNNEAGMFVTCWIGILELSTGKLSCANAGHEYPALRRADGSFELVRDKHGFILAGMEGSRYKPYELQLNPGDVLFVYTDGVTEATNAETQLFGEDRLVDALNKHPGEGPETILPGVKATIDEFVGEAPQFDDITMLSIRYYGPEGKK